MSTGTSFASIYSHRFARVAACTVPVALADPATNAEHILAAARDCHQDSVAVAVFPELSLTGYSIDDLHLQDPVSSAVEAALRTLTAATEELLPVLVVGAPLRYGHRMYNCAVVIHAGRILGVVPKTMIPTYREFYEGRQFASGAGVHGAHLHVAGQGVPFGTDLLFAAEDYPDLVLGVELCEDMWVPVTPGAQAALAGATVLANLSASPVSVGRARERDLMCRSASARAQAAYVYTAAGQGESSNDLSWDGQSLVYEAGDLLAETERFNSASRAVADVHLARLRAERIRQGTFADNAAEVLEETYRTVTFTLSPPQHDVGLRRHVRRFPFVPDDAARLAQDCYEAFHIQVSALVQRMRAIGGPKLIIGVSGGLDSTHALLVCARAMDQLGRPRSDILAYTMPGFGTSETTRANAWELGRALGVSFDEIDITGAARGMLADIDHPFARGEEVYDVTFENVQAGLRTDYLFRLAGDRGGIVVGTGDMSELALGWCTYGVGDQMSHYGLNAGLPKTLIQHLIRWVISSGLVDAHTTEVLQAVLETTISPELVPAQGGQVQSTEEKIGPYALQDFTLFHLLRRGLAPWDIAFLAQHAWSDLQAGSWPPGYPESARAAYDLAEIRHWMEVFIHRFFTSQFKRTAVPNGPKVVGGGALSPRGEWRAPADGGGAAWQADLQRVPRQWPGH